MQDITVGNIYGKINNILYNKMYSYKILNEHIFKNKKNGIFIDIGAHDGITNSHTFFFENTLKWSGICIEPHTSLYNDLISHRKCVSLNCCVYDHISSVEFAEHSGLTESLSGIVSEYTADFINKITQDNIKHFATTTLKQKDTYTLNHICRLFGVSSIDYLVIDTNCSEYKILHGIDFDNLNIKVISIKNNIEMMFETIYSFLLSKKYHHFGHVFGNEIFIKHE